MRPRRYIVLLLLGLGALSQSCSRLNPSDGGVTCDVPVEECSTGFLHGVCGEGDAPVLACGTSTCRWYVGGCPAGLQPSDCPVENPCCHSTPDGPWPFADPSPDGADSRILSHLAAMGGEVVTPTSPSVSITIDPSVIEHSPVLLTCSEGNPVMLCRESGPIFARRVGGGTTVVRFAVDGDHNGYWVWLELLEHDGELYARAFEKSESDTSSTGHPTRCPDDRRVFTGGSLVLNTRDIAAEAPLHGVLDLTQADGHSLRIEF